MIPICRNRASIPISLSRRASSSVAASLLTSPAILELDVMAPTEGARDDDDGEENGQSHGQVGKVLGNSLSTSDRSVPFTVLKASDVPAGVSAPVVVAEERRFRRAAGIEVVVIGAPPVAAIFEVRFESALNSAAGEAALDPTARCGSGIHAQLAINLSVDVRVAALGMRGTRASHGETLCAETDVSAMGIRR